MTIQNTYHTWQSPRKTLGAGNVCPVCMAIHIVTSTLSSIVSADWSTPSSREFSRHDAHASKSWVGSEFPASSDSEPDRDLTMSSNLYTFLKVFNNARNSLKWGTDFLSVNLFKQFVPSLMRMGWKRCKILSSIGLQPTEGWLLLCCWPSTAHATSRNFETPLKHSSYKLRLLEARIKIAMLGNEE